MYQMPRFYIYNVTNGPYAYIFHAGSNISATQMSAFLTAAASNLDATVAQRSTQSAQFRGAHRPANYAARASGDGMGFIYELYVPFLSQGPAAFLKIFGFYFHKKRPDCPIDPKIVPIDRPGD